MDATKASGWLQFGAGVAALVLQILGAIHGVSVDWGHSAVAAGLTANGLNHLGGK